MNSNGKKISFLFNKLSKKPNAFSSIPKEDKSVEFIDCLEGTEIKVKNAIEKIEKAPLVIPIKGDANNIVSQIERESLKNKKIKTETSSEDSRPDSELTIEELAARQLLREARNKLEQNKDTTKIHTLPLEDNAAVQDGIEPSMDDYESVPIEDFGLACLRGMGWKEGMSIGKNQSKCVKPPEPNLRPKGLGLGAQKILDIQNKDVFDKNGKKLVLAKGVFAKIVAGSQKGKLCEVQFCDEWSGRVAVKLNNTDEIVTLNGLFLVPITKEDYIRESKVINNAKFEQYKLMEENKRGSSHDKIFIDGEPKSSEEIYENRAGTSQIKKEEVSVHKYERMRGDQTIIKTEHSSDEDISVKSESRIHKYETEKKKSKDSSTKEFNRESKYDYERTRSKEKYIDQNRSKYGKDYSKDCNTSNTMNESSTSESSDDSDERKHAKPEKSSSKPEKWHSDRRKSKTKNASRSKESPEEYGRKTSKIRNRSRSRSSSIEYDRKYREKTDEYMKYSKEKRSARDSSRYSDDDYEENRNSRKCNKNAASRSEESPEEYGRKKSKRRNRSRSRSSSIEYNRKYREKTDEYMKYSKEKRSGKDSSRYSDDDYEEKRNSRKSIKDSREEIHKDKKTHKSKKKKSHKKRRDSSSESDYSKEKIKHKSRH